MWRYQILILILTPFIVTYTFSRAVKFKNSRYLFQRFCFIKFAKYKDEKPIWFHAASVGEVIAIIPLIKRISKTFPKTPIIITSNTTTSAEIIKTQLCNEQQVQHYYMPIDWEWAVKKIITCLQPRCIFIVETEIWPNLFNISYTRNIPIIILNARLSHRTTTAKPWLLHIYKIILKNVTVILTRSKQDYYSYLKLGAQKSKLKFIGNIKLASSTNNTAKSISLSRPYVVAASTHEDEEKLLTSIWMELIKNKIVTTEFLVIVPRHPERALAISQQLKKLNANVSIRNNNEEITDLTNVYIANTVGELKQFMANANFVFMGGSLIPHGGQNIIEPAQLSKAIIFGQYMFNFKDECKLLLDNNAAIQVNNRAELYESFKQLLMNPDKVTQLSESAAKIILKQGNTILEHYFSEIEQYITPEH